LTRTRLPASLAAAMMLTLAMAPMAHAQAHPSGVYTLNQAASVIDFSIYGSAIFKIKRDGQFKEFTGQLSYDPASPASTDVDLTVYTGSVDMHNAEQDQLLKSGEFFDVERFPTMHFKSSSTEVKPDGTFSMIGDMTIRGITQRLTIPVRLRPAPASGAVFETTFQIDRTAFGLNGIGKWNGVKVSISKTVQVHIAIATAPTTSQLSR
jgi:polyisoprenoid-binding protein YceI